MRRSKARRPGGPPPSGGHPGASPFPIVGLGASAGGLEAFSQLLGLLPPDTGMAFVLIQHLDPAHPSHLVDAAARATAMPCQLIADGLVVAPDHVYVIPPSADAGILRGTFTLFARPRDPHPPARAVDFFFCALAADQGNRAIGVVLSGTGSDGTEGLRAIQAADGVAFAQEPSSAKFAGMPESAIAAGVVDLVAPVPELVQALRRIGSHPYLRAAMPDEPQDSGQEERDEFRRILFLLRSTTGVDVSDYKPSTIRRRLARRMALRQQVTLRDYLALLQEAPGEVVALLQDLLVNVTSFFRDPEVWDSVRETVLPEILKSKPSGAAIRVWVPGCSTGEEAYSIAICLLEALGANAQGHTVQIFATDLGERAIATARAGLYAESALRDVSAARLQAFFTRTEKGYRISKSVRDLCVFVPHDVVGDPPFSKLDLVSCRNLLIYFNQALQARVAATFHFALQVPGFLLIGKSESLADPGRLFTLVDREARVFARSRTASALRFPAAPQVRPAAARPATDGAGSPATPDLIRQAENLLLGQYAPPGVVVDDRGEILQFRGRTGPFLEPAPGQPRHMLLEMARPGLLADLRIALARARKSHATVRRPGVRVQQDGRTVECDVVVAPLPGPPGQKERAFVVLFESTRPDEAAAPGKARARGAPGGTPARAGDRRVAELAAQLKASKEYLQSIADEHRRANDELASANEELVSSNEELQSLNEELETAKEELQSTNEELATLNDELQHRNAELNVANGDLANVMNSVELPVVIVDGARRIRRFTPRAVAILRLRDSDVGRPFDEIRPHLLVDDLDRQVAEVIDTLTPTESEVQDRKGCWYRLQIRPYLSVDRKIDGAVLTLVDIDALKRTLAAIEWARDYAAGTVEAVQTPLVVLDERLAVLSANGAYYEAFGASKADTVGRPLFELGNGHWDVPALRVPLVEMLGRDSSLTGLEVACQPKGLGHRVMSLSARPVHSMTGVPMIVLSIDDVSQRKRDEAERGRLLSEAQEARAASQAANRAKDVFLAVLSHELRTPLSSLLLQAQLLRRVMGDPAKLERASEAIERAARAQAALIDDLLDASRIATGKLKVDLQPSSLPGVIATAVESVRPAAERKSLALELALDESLPPVSGDPARLQQVVLNLLTNAIKFTPEGGRIAVALERLGDDARIRVRDTGVGIEPDFLPQVFSSFVQADPSRTRTQGGLGLGLTIVRHLVEAHGGTVQAESPGKGGGATFTVSLPLLRHPTGVAAAAPLSGPTPGLARRDLHGLRLLVVDDDEGTREALAGSLAHAGAEVRTASSAAGAMEIFEGFAPQVLVCDIAMPGEDGASLLRRIRALGPGRHGDLPAVALTALAGEDDRQRTLAAGFQLHLVKPLGVERLADAVASLLPAGDARPGRAWER